MSSEIKISVVIATFNRKQLLARTLPTLFNQDIPPETYEIVVVDDGSTDGTAQLLRSFKPACKLRILDQPNSGQAMACNKGFLAATGELLLLLDDDIICPPNLLREHIKAHEGFCKVVVSGPVNVSAESPLNFVTDWMLQAETAYERNHGLADKRHWPDDTKLDANSSICRQELLDCGGFAPEVSEARFDVELGLKLHRRGFRFLYRPSASASQICSKSARTVFQDAKCYGRNELLITRKYPEFRASSHLAQISEGALCKRIARNIAVRSPIFPEIFTGMVNLLETVRFLPASKEFNLRLFQAAYSSCLLRAAVSLTGSWKVFCQEFGLQLPVLLYHHVGPRRSGTFNHLTVSPRKFEKQVAWLSRNGYQGITPEDWLLWVCDAKKLPEKPVLLTFDDGFKDLAEHAFPVLAKYGFGAAVYIVTSQIGEREFTAPANGSCAHALLSADEIRFWADRGIEFGSHTVAHANLIMSTEEELAHDIATSKQELSKVLRGRDVVSFAYPSGCNNAAVRQAVSAKHRIAFTTDVGLNHLGSDLLRLNRSMVQPGDSLLDLRLRVRLGWNPIQGARRRIAQLRGRSTVAVERIPARRVLHILGTAQQEGTGIARIISNLAKGIDPQKYEVTVCFIGAPGPLIQEFQAAGISTRIVPWKHPYRDPLGLLGLCRQLTKEHFDIVHAHWGGRGVRWIASRVGRAKVLFHLHGRLNERDGPNPIRMPAKNADAVIAVSSAVANVSSHKNTRTIYSGVEVPDVAQGATGGMTIGTVGRLLPLKGINYLLSAISTLRDDFPHLRLEVVGDGSERSELQKQAIALGLTDIVKFLGWLPEVNSARANWQVFVQPSLEEGLPVALLEAMAAGLPIIASDVGGIPEIIEHGVTGTLVAPGNPVALSQSLREMLLDSELRQRFGNAARLRIRQQFSPESMVRQISEVYDELLMS